LARLGGDYRNPKALPRVASVEKQAEFITIYKRLLNELESDLAADSPFQRLQAIVRRARDAVQPDDRTKKRSAG